MTPSSDAQRRGLAATRSALLLSADALAVALFGALLETLDWKPLFAAPGEPARDALRQLRPTLVLADCAYEPVWSAAFLGPARMLGVPVIIFGATGSADTVRRLAAQHGLPSLLLPIDADSLAQRLQEALAMEQRPYA